MLDNARYRRDEHCSSVVTVEKEQKMDMIRHDDVVVDVYRRIYVIDLMNGFFNDTSVLCQNDIGRTTNGRPYGNL